MAMIHPGSLSNVQTFSGKSDEDAYEWPSHVNKAADLFGWTNEQRTAVATLKMHGLAGQWARSMPVDIHWQALSAALLERFGDCYESLLSHLYRCIQGPNERAKAFNDRFRTIKHRLEMLQPVMPNQPENLMFKAQYLRSLMPELRTQVATQKPASLEAAMCAATYFDELHLGKGPSMPSSSGMLDPFRSSSVPFFRRPFNNRNTYHARYPTNPEQVSGPSRWPPSSSKPHAAINGASLDQIQQQLENLKLMYEASTHDRAPWMPVDHEYGSTEHIRSRHAPMTQPGQVNIMVDFRAPHHGHAGSMERALPLATPVNSYATDTHDAYSNDYSDVPSLVSDDESDVEPSPRMELNSANWATTANGYGRTRYVSDMRAASRSCKLPVPCTSVPERAALVGTSVSLPRSWPQSAAPPPSAAPASSCLVGHRTYAPEEFKKIKHVASEPSLPAAETVHLRYPLQVISCKEPQADPALIHRPGTCVNAARSLAIKDASIGPDSPITRPLKMQRPGNRSSSVKPHLNLLEEAAVADQAPAYPRPNTPRRVPPAETRDATGARPATGQLRLPGPEGGSNHGDGADSDNQPDNTKFEWGPISPDNEPKSMTSADPSWLKDFLKATRRISLEYSASSSEWQGDRPAADLRSSAAMLELDTSQQSGLLAVDHSVTPSTGASCLAVPVSFTMDSCSVYSIISNTESALHVQQSDGRPTEAALNQSTETGPTVPSLHSNQTTCHTLVEHKPEHTLSGAPTAGVAQAEPAGPHASGLGGAGSAVSPDPLADKPPGRTAAARRLKAERGVAGTLAQAENMQSVQYEAAKQEVQLPEQHHVLCEPPDPCQDVYYGIHGTSSVINGQGGHPKFTTATECFALVGGGG